MQNIAKLIDHTLLNPDATDADIVNLCEEACRYGFYSVCIHPHFIAKVREIIFKTKVKIVAVIGFPLGMSLPEIKIYEAVQSVLKGADELDIVMNIGAAKSNKWTSVEKEIADIVTATPKAVHKIIIETCYLTDHEKKKACSAVVNAGAKFVKTSTGFGPAGASVKDVELIKSAVKGKARIKAAGGIKTLADVNAFIDGGASRIGTSSGVGIMKEALKRETHS